MRRVKWNEVAAILVLVAAGAWFATGEFGTSNSHAAPERADPGGTHIRRKVAVVPVVTEPYSRKIVVSGRTEPKKTVYVTARVSGIVEDIVVQKGRHVDKDAVVARLTDEGRTAALRQAEALVAQRSAEYEAAQKLTLSGNNTRLSLTASKASLDAANALLEQAQVNVTKLTLTSPTGGIVDQIPVEEGQSVTDGTRIATIIKLNPLVIAAEVSERSVASVVIGQPAEVRLVGGGTLAAKVTYISRAASEKTRTYRIEVEADNDGSKVAAGLTAEVVIPSGQVPATRLPRSVLSLDAEGRVGVRAAGPDGKVSFLPIEILDDTPAGLFVAGIADKTLVIVTGQDFVKAGDLVEAVQASPGGDSMNIVDIAIRNFRLTLACLVFALVAGALAYATIPKEAEPDIRIPIVYVQLSLRGISPEDSERLLLRPIETRLKTVTNVKEMRSAAYEGGGYVLLEFNAGFDSSSALADVRAKVDDAKSDLPTDADEPVVREVNLSLLPVLVVTLAGDAPERTMTTLGRDLKLQIEQIPGVLSANISGVRDDLVEIVVDPMQLDSYGVALDQLLAIANSSNQLVAAGNMEGAEGRYAVKLPSLIEGVKDIADIPLVANSNAAVRALDVATVRRTYKDPTNLARLNGRQAVTIEVSKRTGSNLIETVDAVRAVSKAFADKLPPGISVSYSQDKSIDIRNLLSDLQNSVITGVILVFVVILFALGGRASMMIGLAIPTSFLMGILWLSLAGLTVNIVVLFSLILAVGMLVDDAIIVAEYAERRMELGMAPKEAYSEAAKRMAGPVFAATATRVAAFSPLLFWPGVVGEFMKYMPITLIATLSASLLFSLVFTPTLGALFGAPAKHQHPRKDGVYMATVKRAVDHPFIALGLTVCLLVAVPWFYGKHGKGVEFFPDVEPKQGLLHIHARGNLSLSEKDALVRPVEQKLLAMKEIETVYTRVGELPRGGQDEAAEDVIGVIQFEFVDWTERRTAKDILADIRAQTSDMVGVDVEPRTPRAGPAQGKALQIELTATDPALILPAAEKVTAMLRARPAAVDIDDAKPAPGIDWRLDIKRSEAAKYGISVGQVGAAVRLLTNGLKLTEYRPSDTTDAVDIVLRFPSERRTLATLDELRIMSPTAGNVPIGNIVERKPVERVGTLKRVNGQRVLTVQANIREGVAAADEQLAVASEMSKLDLGGVRWRMKGEDEERRKASAFLGKAFGAALFMIFAVLLAQFNKFTSVFLVLSSVIFSTIGVFLGILIMGQSFGVVMTGIGIIALAGVVVNNNIVLIDTYDRLMEEGWEKRAAVLETCRERARPVVLTAVTAILGVLPIAFGLNLDVLHHETTYGAPSTQWWIQLSSAIVYGLAFATVLTLVITPSMLMIFTRGKKKVKAVETSAVPQPAGE